MAIAAQLLPGFRYRIRQVSMEAAALGLDVEDIITIVDNTPYPHDHEDPSMRRKITVKAENGIELLMLPRQIDSQPVGVDHPALPAQPAPVVSATPLPATLTLESGEEIATPEIVVTADFKPITDPMDPRLDHLRPNRKVVKDYVARVMDEDTGLTDTQMFMAFVSDAYRRKNEGYPRSFMLKGDTQCGKTMLVQVLACLWADQLGYARPMPIYTLNGSSGITDYDLFGQPATFTDPTTGRTVVVWLPGIVEMSSWAGGILYLDEVNAIPERVTVSMHSYIDHRHQFVNRAKPVLLGGQFMPETTKAPLDLWVCGTLNDDKYQGMTKLNEAFKNRFTHVSFEYDPAVEKKLIDSPTIHLLAEFLRTARKNNPSIRTPVGTSALMNMETDIAVHGIKIALKFMVDMFEPSERGAVREIIDGRSIEDLLLQEQAQAQINEDVNAKHAAGKADDATARLKAAVNNPMGPGWPTP